MIDIDKAFEGRWRIKAKDNVELIPIALPVDIKELCRDFFEAGVMLGQGFVTSELILADDTPTGIEVTVMHDSILDTADNGFSEWWDMYGKKVDRKKCIKKWNRLSDEEKRLCLKATPAYVASTPDVTYRKNPLTYLNGECWNDEIIVKNGNQPTKQQQDLNKLASILTD